MISNNWIQRSIHLSFYLALLTAISFSATAEEPPADYFLAKPGSLAKARQRITSGDKESSRVLKKLVGDADNLLQEKPYSVMDKTRVPPSGDKHDYISMAPYFWPDPKTKDGLPYLRHDGKVNPESRDAHSGDSTRISRMGDAIETLSLAYYFTTNEAYAAKAASFAKTWFLDSATKMNPNFKFAQAVPGKNTGRGTGILEGRHIAIEGDAIRLLNGSKSWTTSDQQAMSVWLTSYLNWLLTSEEGQEEHNAKNNHGSWFDVQTAELALSIGSNGVAHQIIENAKKKRIAIQIEPDGKQPLELERTKSFDYSCFNLKALCELATLGEHCEVDLWHFSTSDGRSIHKALEFLLPYLDKPTKQWPFEQIKQSKNSEFIETLKKASLEYDQPEFKTILAKYPEASGKTFQLLLVK